ncbi:hypothetical protein KM043_017241 [Ampulex compressa]|nr:hypothetical protein KM043_017241 [Ampulex compressa]
MAEMEEDKGNKVDEKNEVDEENQVDDGCAPRAAHKSFPAGLCGAGQERRLDFIVGTFVLLRNKRLVVGCSASLRPSPFAFYRPIIHDAAESILPVVKIARDPARYGSSN